MRMGLKANDVSCYKQHHCKRLRADVVDNSSTVVLADEHTSAAVVRLSRRSFTGRNSPDFIPPHLHLSPPLEVTPFEFRNDFCRQRTRVPGLPFGVVCVNLCVAVSIQCRSHRAVKICHVTMTTPFSGTICHWQAGTCYCLLYTSPSPRDS